MRDAGPAIVGDDAGEPLTRDEVQLAPATMRVPWPETQEIRLWGGHIDYAPHTLKSRPWPRDDAYRRKLNVPTLADRVLLRSPDDLRPDPARAAREAADRVASQVPGWWLHTDLDVLARSEFTACGAPGETLLPGGLTWEELTEIVSSVLRTGACRGWSIAVYNPDLDPGKQAAARIVRFVTDVVRSWS